MNRPGLAARGVITALLVLCLSPAMSAQQQAAQQSAAQQQAAQPAATEPQAAVEQLHELLLQAMQTPQQAQRELLLREHVLSLFDVAGIARISVGKTWRRLEQDQQQRFITLLGELIVATYADRFDDFSGQRFVTDEVKAASSGWVVVTRLLRQNDEPVTLDYYLRRNRVFNVVADGVSDLSLRRADYNSIVKQEGFDSLLAHIHAKLEETRGGPVAAAANGSG